MNPEIPVAAPVVLKPEESKPEQGKGEGWRPALSQVTIVFLVVQVACVAASLTFPDRFHYLSPGNVAVTLKAIPPLGVLALGVGLLMIAGEFDLSVGSVYTFTALVMAKLTEGGLSPYLGLLAALLLGAAIGVTNGLVALRFSLPSFIVTLGSLLFWKGAALLYHGATAEPFRPPGSFRSVFSGDLAFGGGYSANLSFFWLLGITAICYLLLHHHWFGNHLLATGGNRRAAVSIGIPVGRTKLAAFALAGACAAFAGALACTRVGSIQPGQGQGLELQAIAACVIGGVALVGGRGSAVGIVLGTVLIYTIQDILLLVGAPGFYLEMFVGALIVTAAILNQLSRRSS